MVFVVTADQIASRAGPDLVDSTIVELSVVTAVRPFTRTLGDEIQALFADAVSVVDAMVILMRSQEWHMGVGIGQAERPVPHDLRAARGSVFLAARAAVDQAKRNPSHLSVRAGEAGGAEAAEEVEVVLTLVGDLVRRRTDQQTEAVLLASQRLTQQQIGQRIGITRQAVGQRLKAASWQLELDARPVLARLLSRTEALAGAESGHS